MSPIPLSHYSGAFGPEMAAAMAMVVEEVCRALSINDDAAAREAIAIRIVELARRGERNPDKLRDRLLRGANNVTGMRAQRALQRRDESPAE